MTTISEEFRRRLLSQVLGDLPREFEDGEIYVRSHHGRLVAEQGSSTLPRRMRLLLLLVDGRSTVGQLRSRLIRFRGFEDCLDMLRSMGLIEALPEGLDF